MLTPALSAHKFVAQGKVQSSILNKLQLSKCHLCKQPNYIANILTEFTQTCSTELFKLHQTHSTVKGEEVACQKNRTHFYKASLQPLFGNDGQHEL